MLASLLKRNRGQTEDGFANLVVRKGAKQVTLLSVEIYRELEVVGVNEVLEVVS